MHPFRDYIIVGDGITTRKVNVQSENPPICDERTAIFKKRTDDDASMFTGPNHGND